MSDAVDPALVVVRFFTYGLAILLFGSATFRLYILPRGDRGAGLRVVAPAALAVSTLAYAVLLAREVADAPGWPPASVLADLYATTGFGRALATTCAAAALIATAGLFRQDEPRRRLALSGVALVALAFVGHAADGQGPTGAARLAVMVLHLLAVGAWLGALPLLAIALRANGPDALPLLHRFGSLGAVAVVLVLATGVGSLAFVALATPAALGPVYVRVLLVKLFLVLGLLMVAAINRFRLTPAIAADAEQALRALRRSIVLEQALGLGAILTIAILGQLDPTM